MLRKLYLVVPVLALLALPALSRAQFEAGNWTAEISGNGTATSGGSFDSFDAGITYPAIGEIYVKRAIIMAASKVYMLADSTKIGRMSFSSLGGVELVHTLITDDGISPDDIVGFEDQAIENFPFVDGGHALRRPNDGEGVCHRANPTC